MKTIKHEVLPNKDTTIISSGGFFLYKKEHMLFNMNHLYIKDVLHEQEEVQVYALVYLYTATEYYPVSGSLLCTEVYELET